MSIARRMASASLSPAADKGKAQKDQYSAKRAAIAPPATGNCSHDHSAVAPVRTP
jgi:hypothetical protein